MKTYITFGQAHRHVVGGVVFDHNCVAVIEHAPEESGRDIAFQYFGPKWAFEYSESRPPEMSYFPRGFVTLPREVPALRTELTPEQQAQDYFAANQFVNYVSIAGRVFRR